MPRFNGFDPELLENVIRDVPDGQKKLARELASIFGGKGGSLAYAEAGTVDNGQKKYNFIASPDGKCWLALQGTKGVLSISVSDPKRLAIDTDWYEVKEAGSQFEKGGWRSLWPSIDNPSPTQSAALIELLRRIHRQAS